MLSFDTDCMHQNKNTTFAQEKTALEKRNPAGHQQVKAIGSGPPTFCVWEYINKMIRSAAAVTVTALLTLKPLCRHYASVCTNVSEWWLALRRRTAICSLRDTQKETTQPSGLSRLRICVNKCVLACICVGSLINKWGRVWGCCSTSNHDNPSFFPHLSLSFPKIGCTSFVTSHECFLNLLWRDLSVNLFPVEKAKPWNRKPKIQLLYDFF